MTIPGLEKNQRNFHIIFYRGLGFSLNQIKEILVETKTDKNADRLLSAQKIIKQHCRH